MIIQNIFTQTFAYQTLDVDNDKILKFCYDLKNKDPEGRVLSNFGGWQSKEFYGPVKELDELLNQIESCVTEYSKIYSFNKNIPQGNIWVNINKNNDHNILHDHPGSLMTAVYYVKVPENSGQIQFYNPLETYDQYVNESIILEYNGLNSSTYSFYPHDKQLILFPSWLKHCVCPSQTDLDRISITVNFGFA